MNAIEVTDKQEIFKVLFECFKTDIPLVQKWHIIAPESFKECAQKTFNDLMKCADLKFFEVKKEENLMGYFGKETWGEEKLLTGFFVKPEYRNKEDMTKFWYLIQDAMGRGTFYSMVYPKNIPANDYLKNRGGEMIAEAKFNIYRFN